MALSDDEIRSYAAWVVDTLSDGSARPLQPSPIAAALQSSGAYGEDNPVNSETIRRLIRYAEDFRDGKPVAAIPRPTTDTARRLASAISRYKQLDPAIELAHLGLVTNNSEITGEAPEPSEAFPLIYSFHDCQRPFLRVHGTIRGLPGSIEIETLTANQPTADRPQSLVLAVKLLSDAVISNIALKLEELERQKPYFAINLVYDIADVPRVAIRRAALASLRRFALLPEAISVQPAGEFLDSLFDNVAAAQTLENQYRALSITNATIDPFSDEGYLVIDSVLGSSGSENGGAELGDHLDEQLYRLLAAPHPIRCMVRGPFGAGKTTAIYRAAAKLIQAAGEREARESYQGFLETPRPLIIPAASMLGGGDILERLAEALRSWYRLPIFIDNERARPAAAFLTQLIRSGVVVLFIDSLDESPALSQTDRITELLDTLPGYRIDQHRSAGESIADDRSKYVFSYRPEIFQSTRVEERLLHLNKFAIEELRDYSYTLTLVGPREELRSPFGADVLSRTSEGDRTSVVLVAEGLVKSLSNSPLFRSMSAQGGFDVQALRRTADEFAHREGENPRFLYELYAQLSDIAMRWEERERDRDSSRSSAGSSVTSDRRARLEGCSHIALAMLGREDCSRHGESAVVQVNYALPAEDLRRVTEQNLLTTERVRDQIDQGRQKEEMQLIAWYDARVGMMLVTESDTARGDRQIRYRFPNAAMEALFIARGLHHMLDTFERGQIDPASLEYPFEPHAVVGPLCRSLIDDRMRGAVMLLAGKLLAARPDARSFPDEVLAALRDAARSSGPNNELGTCISEHPLLALNVATICLWLKELLDFGHFEADLSQIPLAGLSLCGWTWPELVNASDTPVARDLDVSDAVLEDTHLQGYQLHGTPRLRGALERPDRIRMLAPLGRTYPQATTGDPAADRWAIIPGGRYQVNSFRGERGESGRSSRTSRRRQMRGQDREGGRDTGGSVQIEREDGEPRTSEVFVPTFLMQQTPTSNAQFLFYLQGNGSSAGWPLEERRRTSNPWYLYDWSHLEFLFGSDLLQWPTRALAEKFRELARPDFDHARARQQVLDWLGRRRTRQNGPLRKTMSQDPIERTGWLFSPGGPFKCADEADIPARLEADPTAIELLFPVLALFENWLHRPLTRVNWRVATTFARYHGWSLPSEVEFEAAALWWRDIAGQHGQGVEALREIELGFAQGPELWRMIEAQLHAYQPNIAITTPPWKESPAREPIDFSRLQGEPSDIANAAFLKLARAYQASWHSEEELVDAMMPPAYLTGLVGTWTRDVYDPSWPLGFAALTSGETAERALYHPVNHGFVDAKRLSTSKNELPVPIVGDLSEEPLRTIRGRGLRYGWPRGMEYRFGQQETNVNPDVGLRCVKHLHLAGS